MTLKMLTTGVPTLAALATALAVALASGQAASADTPAAAKPKPATYSELLARTQPSDWRALDPDNTLYMDLPGGRVVIELAPTFAPLHAANIKALVREGYFDNLAILRAQDNYVVQWGDPEEDDKRKKPLKSGKPALAAEFTRGGAKDLPFTRLADRDGYAPEVGFSNGFPAARDPQADRAWLTHCYGMVGAGRDVDETSGPGSELYVVTGHAPRHLDRNIALVGRVVQGMPLLSSLPRGTGNLGFYEKAEQRVPIKSIRLAADVPAAQRTNLEIIRTDTPAFAALVEALRNRGGDWFKVPAGYVELCNVAIAVRAAK